jgi:hypothetical protein
MECVVSIDYEENLITRPNRRRTNEKEYTLEKIMNRRRSERKEL